MPRLLICDQIDVNELGLGPKVEVDYRPTISHEELLGIAGTFDAILVRSRTKVDREVLDKATRLKLVARPGTGLDNIDVGYAESKGVKVINSPESLVEAVSEHVVALMLALSRHLVDADKSTKSGGWEKNSLTGTELKSKTLGVVGFGRIGRRIAEIAHVLGMPVLVYDVIPIPPDALSSVGARLATLDQLFGSADYITLHVPLTEETRHLVDSARLSKMKPTSFLVNTSRGGVVDEAALSKALEDRKIMGAALDVFEQEPPSGAILTAPRTILTPHVGGQTQEAQGSAVRYIGEKVAAFFSGT
ncbi:MAG: hydroxyacid dehydrogenase [archaeon]|nr:MAG: hydroxyacid dehydrogenase [archaeon]